MKKSRFTEEKIIAALKEHERGGTATEIGRRLGVTAQNVLSLEGEVRRNGGVAGQATA